MEKHEKFLFAVLDRWSEVRLTIDGDKCEFRMSKLTFFGHELTSNGLNPHEEKIAAIYIWDARPPKAASEVRSFMGLVQYSEKFMPDVTAKAKPVQELTRKETVFHWDKEQQFAFEELKRLITQAETLAYFKNFECFNCSVFIRLDTLWMKVHAENTDTPNKSLIIRSKNLVAKNLRAMRTCCIHGCQWQTSSCLTCEILL